MMLRAISLIVCRKWQKIHSIVGIVYEPVHDVAFAPNLGRCDDMLESTLCVVTCLSRHRSYHVLAVASKDVDIIHLVPSGCVSHSTQLENRGIGSVHV